MAFSELRFVFLFLPLALLLHKVMPIKVKNLILTILSLLFSSTMRLLGLILPEPPL